MPGTPYKSCCTHAYKVLLSTATRLQDAAPPLPSEEPLPPLPPLPPDDAPPLPLDDPTAPPLPQSQPAAEARLASAGLFEQHPRPAASQAASAQSPHPLAGAAHDSQKAAR